MSLTHVRNEVLVVEDDADELELITRYLRGDGVAVVQAEDGIDALSYLFASHPVAVLLDIMMPRMNGIELIAQIRSDPELALVPIVALSGSREMLTQAHNAGASATMLKPLDLTALRELLRHVSS